MGKVTTVTKTSVLREHNIDKKRRINCSSITGFVPPISSYGLLFFACVSLAVLEVSVKLGDVSDDAQSIRNGHLNLKPNIVGENHAKILKF